MASSKRQTKKSYHIQIGKQILLLDACIANQHNNENPLTKDKKQSSKRYFEWFKEGHLLELLKALESIIAVRINSSRPTTRATRQYVDNSANITTQNLKFSYCFKRRSVTVQQYALLKEDKVYDLNGKTRRKERINYDCLSFFHEKLVVNICQHSTESKQKVTKPPLHESSKEKLKDKVMEKDKSSNYFAEPDDCLITSSVKRKKATLKKVAKKSKIALLKLPANEQSEISVENIGNSKSGSQPSHPTTSFPDRQKGLTSSVGDIVPCNSSGVIKPDVEIKKTVIDLEKEPEGLKDVKRVEDLKPDYLKFLIYKMEDYLRAIFRGEVYCRRHEDYKKGGKFKDDLNFQVGMAHFSEDQHDCIMDTLMAIFCYRNTWYIDYVTQVMLPEALIKLYQDIHKTSFEEAEECLFNDTIY